MKYMLLVLLLCAIRITQASEHYIILESPNFELVQDTFFSQSVDFTSLPENKVMSLTYWGNNPKVEIIYNGDNLFVSQKGNSFERVYLQFGEKIKKISFNIQTNPAIYTEEYIQLHKGTVSVETPEVYELNNIILALADKFHQANYRMYAQGEYYADVLTWFSTFKDHEIFMRLNDVDYYSFVENAVAYEFNGDQIQQSSVYKGFRVTDNVKGNISVLEDFAKKSDFKTFYKQHHSYYSTLSNTFQSGARPKDIWHWLEANFPGRYQSYKIFFSPLGPGNNSSRMFSNNDFNESIMFISAPNRYENDEVPLSIQTLEFTRSFFTEIDHTYVNPISDEFIDDINTALVDLKPWYKGGGYNKPYLTFNEYMTWSMVSLYAIDNYSAHDYKYIKNYTEKFMVNKRGFYKFKAFNNELIRLYKNKSIDKKITDLYPEIINWISKKSKST
tara:strand:- start:43270 stop:44604 length:1335 start_codon:yes stop_codon:yes gene_type:complete